MFKSHTGNHKVDPEQHPAIVMPDRFVMPYAENAEGTYVAFREYLILPGAVITGRYCPNFIAVIQSPCGHVECGLSVENCMN